MCPFLSLMPPRLQLPMHNMGPNTTRAEQGDLGTGLGRGNPSPAGSRPLRPADGVGAPSPGRNIDDKGKRPVTRSYKAAIIQGTSRTPTTLTHPATVRVVKERPAGAPGAGPSRAGPPPGPNHWWMGDGWVRWEPDVASTPAPAAAPHLQPAPVAGRRSAAPGQSQQRAPQRRGGGGNGNGAKYEVLLFGPVALQAMLTDGRLAAAIRSAALHMHGFDVHPVLFALAQTASARWETNHVRFTLASPLSTTKRAFERRHAAAAAALKEHLPAMGVPPGRRQWHAIFLVNNRALTPPAHADTTAHRTPLPLLNRFEMVESLGEPCMLCGLTYGAADMLGCDGCDCFFHNQCLPVEARTDDRNEAREWFCPSCTTHRCPPPTTPAAPASTWVVTYALHRSTCLTWLRYFTVNYGSYALKLRGGSDRTSPGLQVAV